MGLRAARIHNYQLAESLSIKFETIWNRISRKYTPMWLLTELDYMRQQVHDIQAEFKRQLDDLEQSK